MKQEENIATPPKYIFVFVNEVFNKNYRSISETEYQKSMSEAFDTQISPWKMSAPSASKEFNDPLKVK